MALSNNKFKEAVASQVAEMGWSGFMSLTNNNVNVAKQLAEGGWSSIVSYVDDLDMDELRADWSHLDDDDSDEDDEETISRHSLTEDEKDFLNKKTWYNNNLSVRESIVIIKNEIKTVNKNVRKRKKFIYILEKAEDKEIGIKDFFVIEKKVEKKSVYRIDGIEVTKRDIDKIKKIIEGNKNNLL